MRTPAPVPDISFLVAAFDAERTLEAAVASALAQTHVTVEVIIVDDVSRDDTLARARALAREEPRITVLAQRINAGPAAARNRALAAATGDWVAILDADDILAPDRSERLIALARQRSSQIVADNLLCFRHEAPGIAWPFLSPRRGGRPFGVELPDYLDGNRMTAGDATLGYLKPMFRRAFLQAHGIVYDEGLRIGEDFNFVLRALCAGGRFTVTPQALYFYRIMAGSLSRRLAVADLERLLLANDHVLSGRLAEPGLRRAAAAYRHAARDLASYCAFRAAIRQGEWRAALQGAGTPRLWATIARMAVHAGRRKYVQHRAAGRQFNHPARPGTSPLPPQA